MRYFQKSVPAFIVMATLSFQVTSCSNFLKPGSGTLYHQVKKYLGVGAVDSTEPVVAGALALGEAIIGDLKAELEGYGLTPEQVAEVERSARNEMKIQAGTLAVFNGINLTDTQSILALIAPAVLKGAMTALGSSSINLPEASDRANAAQAIVGGTFKALSGHSDKIGSASMSDVAQAMMGSAVETLSAAGLAGANAAQGAKAITGGAVGALSSAGISVADQSTVVRALISRTVEKLATTNIPAEFTTDVIKQATAGAVAAISKSTTVAADALGLAAAIAGGSVSGLSTWTLSKEELSEKINSSTQGAVSGLKSGGLESSLALAVNAITQSSVGALANSQFDTTQLTNIAGQVAAGAIRGLDSTGISAADIVTSGAISSAMSGTMVGLQETRFSAADIAAAQSSVVTSAVASFANSSMETAALKEAAIKNVVQGAIESIASTGSANDDTTILNSIQNISLAAMRALSSAGVSEANVLGMAGAIAQKAADSAISSNIATAANIQVISEVISSNVTQGYSERITSGGSSTSSLGADAASIAANVFARVQDASTKGTLVVSSLTALQTAVSNSTISGLKTGGVTDTTAISASFASNLSAAITQVVLEAPKKATASPTPSPTVVASVSPTPSPSPSPSPSMGAISIPMNVAPPYMDGELLSINVGASYDPVYLFKAEFVPTSCSVTPMLPAGLSISPSCVLTGTPSAAFAAETFTATGVNASEGRAKVFHLEVVNSTTDVTPPKVTRIAITPTVSMSQVNTTTAEQYVRVEVEIADNANLGYPLTQCVKFRLASSDGSQYRDVSVGSQSPASDPKTAICAASSITLPKGSKAGIWSLHSLQVLDKQGNFRLYDKYELDRLTATMATPTITNFATVEDNTPATISSITLDKTTINTSAYGEYVYAVVTVTDNMGLNLSSDTSTPPVFIITLEGPSGTHAVSITGPTYSTGGTSETFYSMIHFPPGSESGLWRIRSTEVWDNVRNYRKLEGAAARTALTLPSLTNTASSNSVDLVAPDLVDFSIQYNSYGDPIATLSLTDNLRLPLSGGDGVSYVGTAVFVTQDGQRRAFANWTPYQTVGNTSPTAATFSTSLSPSQDSDPGSPVWLLEKLEFRDIAGNIVRLTPEQVENKLGKKPSLKFAPYPIMFSIGSPYFSTGRYNVSFTATAGGNAPITQYKYKVGLVGSTQCGLDTGANSYSASSKPIGTGILIDTSSLPNGIYRICVIGGTSAGVYQAPETGSTGIFEINIPGPAAPTNLTTTPAGDGSVTLSWTGAQGHTGDYLIVRDTTADMVPITNGSSYMAFPSSVGSSTIAVAATNATTITINNLDNGITNYFRVYSRDYNTSTYSAAATASATTQGQEIVVSTPGSYAVTISKPAWNSTASEYAVVTEEQTSGIRALKFSRISAAGVILSTTAIPLNGTATIAGGKPGLIWNGTKYGVAYLDIDNSLFEMFFATISPAGTVELQLPVSALPNVGDASWVHPGQDLSHRFAWLSDDAGNGTWGITWVETDPNNASTSAIFGTVDLRGSTPAVIRTTLNSSGNANETNLGAGRIAGGPAFGVVHTDDRYSGYKTLFFASFNSAGTAIHLGIPMTPTGDTGQTKSPRVMWDAGNSTFAIAYIDGAGGEDNAYVAKMSYEGGLWTSGPITGYGDSFNAYELSLGWNGSKYVLTVDDQNGPTMLTKLYLVTPNAGQTSSPSPGYSVAVTGAGMSGNSQTVINGAQVSVLYSGNALGPYDMYFQSVNTAGTPFLDGSAIRLTKDDANSSWTLGSVVGASAYGVTYIDMRPGGNQYAMFRRHGF